METTAATHRKGLFITNEGQNVAFTFVLVTTLFLLWGFCNGLIDTMDKHFQNELHPEQIVGLCGFSNLPGLFSDVDSGGLAGYQTWL